MAKTIIDSETVSVNASQKEVFDFLCDFNNIKALLPEDKISDWQSDQDQCSFKIQNAAVIPLVKENTQPNERIDIKSGEKAPFPFTLVVNIEKTGDNTCTGNLHFEGEINAFLKMMVKTPLTNLFNYMAKRLQEVHA